MSNLELCTYPGSKHMWLYVSRGVTPSGGRVLSEQDRCEYCGKTRFQLRVLKRKPSSHRELGSFLVEVYNRETKLVEEKRVFVRINLQKLAQRLAVKATQSKRKEARLCEGAIIVSSDIL